MSHSIPLTRESYDSLQEELKRLIREERPRVIQDISEAREHGDLSENAEYDAAKHRQSFIEGRIQELQNKIARAYVVDLSNLKPDKVVFGATVTLSDTDNDEHLTYRIVGSDESDISLGLISIDSPIARALIGREEGDEVKVTTPKGIRTFEIVAIKYG